MGGVNQSVTSDLLLVGLFSHSGSSQLLFSLLDAMFIMGLLGNTVLLFLIYMDSWFYTPMYFLVSQLSLFNVGFPLVTILKMPSDFLQVESSISFGGCAAQIVFLMLMSVAEGILLALTSYDRYVVVCHPLQYPVLMRCQVCLLMVGAPGWQVCSMPPFRPVTLHFPYCASRIVDHFFCEMPALLKLSCADTSAYELALSISEVLILVFPLYLIATSYSRVLRSVLCMRSKEARLKAFTTCSSHITAPGLFYGAAVFTYMVPGTYHSPQQDNVVSLFYSLITPMLNLLIYSLKIGEV